MKKAICKFIFKVIGWKIKGTFPKDLKKTIIITAPHTSNWDMFLGFIIRPVAGFYSYFLIKDMWTKNILVGWFIKFMGGIGVNRSKKTNVSQQVVEEFEKRDYFIITITPEGTRKYNPKWKTGFWHIAKGANIPLMPIAINAGQKQLEIKEPFYLTDDMEADVERLKSIFRGIKGINPELGVK